MSMATQDTIESLAEQRPAQMPEHIGQAVTAAMDADDGLGTFDPFDCMEPDYAWLRQGYVRQALKTQENPDD